MKDTEFYIKLPFKKLFIFSASSISHMCSQYFCAQFGTLKMILKTESSKKPKKTKTNKKAWSLLWGLISGWIALKFVSQSWTLLRCCYKQKPVSRSQSCLLLINRNSCDGLMIILLCYSELYSEVLVKFLMSIILNEWFTIALNILDPGNLFLENNNDVTFVLISIFLQNRNLSLFSYICVCIHTYLYKSIHTNIYANISYRQYLLLAVL